MSGDLPKFSLPAGIKWASLDARHYTVPELHPEEAKLLSPRATLERRKQFSLGRAAARLALTELGVPAPEAIGKGENREPLWPSGVVGAITHSGDFGLAVVAPSTAFRGIGIDLEQPHLMRRFDVASRICTPLELAWIRDDQKLSSKRCTLLFSAKESIFKAIYPVYQEYFWYEDAELVWDEGSASFTATMKIDLLPALRAGDTLSVQCFENEHYILTFTCLCDKSLA